MPRFEYMAEGDFVSVEQWNAFVDFANAFLDEQSVGREIGPGFVGTRPALPESFFAQITDIYVDDDTQETRYKFKAVRWNGSEVIETEPTFAGEGDDMYASEIGGKGAQIDDVVDMKVGAYSPYEFIGQGGGSASGSGSGGCSGASPDDFVQCQDGSTFILPGCLFVIVDGEQIPVQFEPSA